MTPGVQKQKNLLTVAMVAALTVGWPRARAAEKESTAKPARSARPELQLTVEVPPHWRPFLSDDLAEAFASRLSETFHRRGFGGDVKFLAGEPARPDAPMLAVRLINWRIDRTDNAECTFTAILQLQSQEHDLGVFEHTNFSWNNAAGRWGLAEALGDVADGALRDLATKLGRDGLLPGLPAGRK